MARRRLKSRLYAQLARVGKAAASPARLELLEILAQGERSVEALARETRQPIANASHHLQALRAARLVDARRDGLYVLYRVADPAVLRLTAAIRELAERQYDEVERLVRAYLTARDELEPVGREELLARARRGEVVVVDVRPAVEYRAGHLPGALSVPIEELERRVAELPADREIVAYCRGPWCAASFQAVERLRARGRRARRLVDGFPEWRAAGLPVEAPERSGA